MNHISKHSSILILFVTITFSMFINGCGDEDSTLETKSRQQNIIFGVPYEERDQLVKRAEKESSEQQQDRWWQLATLSRISALMVVETKGTQENKLGSATLTSASQLFSADHAVYNQTHIPAGETLKARYISFQYDWWNPNPKGNKSKLIRDN